MKYYPVKKAKLPEKVPLFIIAIIGISTIVMMSCFSCTHYARTKESFEEQQPESKKDLNASNASNASTPGQVQARESPSPSVPKKMDIVSNMNETPERRLKFASALLTYDPRMQKYQDPRSYDFHTCGNATQMWKTKFRDFLKSVGDNVVNRVLEYKDVIVLFDQENLIGNVIFIPLEGAYPQQVIDPIVFRKYIKWSPPSNIISAIVPEGFALKFEFEAIDSKGSTISKSIPDGITKTFVIAAPIKSIIIMGPKVV